MSRLSFILDMNDNFTFFDTKEQKVKEQINENCIILLDVYNLCIKKHHINRWFTDFVKDLYALD